MTLWLAIGGAFILGVVIANAVSVRRYSPTHVVGEIALGGRGLFFSRTLDGTWWHLRLRAYRCNTTSPDDWRDRPSGAGVREPRRPPPSGPRTASARR